VGLEFVKYFLGLPASMVEPGEVVSGSLLRVHQQRDEAVEFPVRFLRRNLKLELDHQDDKSSSVPLEL
jgi:hypothetical protein